MGKNIKLIIGVLVVALSTSLCIAVALYITKENERTKRILFEKKLAQTMAEKSALGKEISELEVLKSTLEKNYQTASNEARRLQDQLRAMQAEKAQIENELQTKIAEGSRRIDELAKNLEDIRASRDTLNGELVRQRAESANLTELLNKAKQAKEELEKKLAEASQAKETAEVSPQGAVTLEKITVGPGTRFEGQVLVVNREFNFLVTNLGKKQGVRVDDVILVFRGEQLQGKIKVEKLYNGLSLGTPVDDWKLDTVAVGDTVRL